MLLGEDGLMMYRLGGGKAYYKVWQLLNKDAKAEARVAMTEALLDSRVEGAKESKAVVKARAAEMLLGEDGLMLYRFGGGKAYYKVWHLLNKDAKAEARVAMKQARVEAPKESKAVVEARAAEMILGENGFQMYRFGGGEAYYKVWHLINDDAKREAREEMKEAYNDSNAAGGRSKRTDFDENTLEAVHERDVAWAHAKTVLGNSHAIFNTFNNKCKKTKISAGNASVTAINKLANVLKLTGWRLEPECVSLLHLTDKQRAEVITALDSLHTKVQVWSKAMRISFAANQLRKNT